MVNGNQFSPTSSPQTVTLIDLPADGNPVDVAVYFTTDTACDTTINALFTAPPSCCLPPDSLNIKFNSIADTLAALLNNKSNFGSDITFIGDLNEDGNVDMLVGARGLVRYNAVGKRQTQVGGAFILFLDENFDILSFQEISISAGGLGDVFVKKDRKALKKALQLTTP